MSTYTLISSQVLGSSAASVTFSSIPSTYKDLVVRCSVRSNKTSNNDGLVVNINGTTAGYSETDLYGNGSSAASANGTNLLAFGNLYWGYVNSDFSTTSTFSSVEMYIPNYAGSTYKQISAISAEEANQTAAYLIPAALLWSNTAAVTSLSFAPQASGKTWNANSSFYLYGI